MPDPTDPVFQVEMVVTFHAPDRAAARAVVEDMAREVGGQLDREFDGALLAHQAEPREVDE